jgi:ATP-binding cassette subfamily F protein 3
MAGETRPDGGRVELGHQVLLGYYAQHQVDALNLSRTVLEEMEAAATDETRPRCRNILGAFLFSGDDVYKPISVLSGGEKSRVALAKLLLRPSNFLLLDEPTNHLDMQARDVLMDALRGYGGTIVFVSHDRRFINGLANRVVHVEGGRVESYPGDYEYYHFKRTQQEQWSAEAAASSGEEDGGSAGSREARREQKRREADRRNELHRRTRSLRERLQAAEADIAKREERVQALEVQMADPGLYNDAARAQAVSAEYAEHKAQLQALYDTWADLAARIEGIEEEVLGVE